MRLPPNPFGLLSVEEHLMRLSLISYVLLRCTGASHGIVSESTWIALVPGCKGLQGEICLHLGGGGVGYVGWGTCWVATMPQLQAA